MSGHTPGPWRVYQYGCNGHHHSVVQFNPASSDDDHLGWRDLSIWQGRPESCGWVLRPADARLISAAPDMAEALKATLRELTACANQLSHHGYKSPEGGSVHSAQQEARAALAKAGVA